ncbi:MAG: hypothetical protein ABSD44_05255 [Terracidiphilus sp.]
MRSEQVITVFVSSPSDLDQENTRLEEVVKELNSTWSRKLGVRLDLVRWATHGYPGMGEDAQDVLNQELPDDYDIFVGVMWARFGTPTGRAHSGTEEEFLRALARYRSSPESVKVMFYFKNAPLAPNSIDVSQLELVQKFKRSLGDEGALYWHFVSLEEFEGYIRIHLSRLLQESGGTRNPRPQTAIVPVTSAISREDDDAGLIDLLELTEGYFADLTQTLERMTADSTTLGAKMVERGAEMARASEAADGNMDRQLAKLLIDRAADDMNRYVSRTRFELPLFKEALRKGTDTAVRVGLISVELGQADRSAAQATKKGLTQLADTLGEVRGSIATFKATVKSLPRLTSVLNRAKRDTAEVMDEMIDVMAEARALLVEAAKSVEALLTKTDSPTLAAPDLAFETPAGGPSSQQQIPN